MNGKNSFSERHGYKQPKPMQRGEIDADLRNDLWGVFFRCFPRFQAREDLLCRPHEMYAQIWTEFLHRPADQFRTYDDRVDFVKNIFVSESWHVVFHLLEFCLQKVSVLGDYEAEVNAITTSKIPRANLGSFEQQCNRALEGGNSAYRIIAGLVTEITSKEEIQTIDRAINVPFAGAKEHIYQAHALLAARENPDYRNSIKESISAVESLAKTVTGEKQGTLGQLTDRLNLHPAFSEGLAKLYGFTSDADGIRHGGAGKPLAADQNTARFMLVICSAFVNYIISRNE